MKRLPNWPLALLIFAVFVIFSMLHEFPHDVEHWSADLVASITSEGGKSSSWRDKIVLVYISDATLEKLPYVSPIDRERLAKIVNAVKEAQAEVIGLDIILDRSTETDKDECLKSVLKPDKNSKAKIVLGAIDTDEKGIHEQKEYFANNEAKIGCLYFDEHHAQGLVVSDHVVRFMAKQLGEEKRACTLSNKLFAEALAEAATAAGAARPLEAAKKDLVPEPNGWFLERSPQIAWLLPPIKKETSGERNQRLYRCIKPAFETAIGGDDWLQPLLYCARSPVASDTFLTLPAEYVLGLDLKQDQPDQKKKRDAELKDLLHDNIVLIGGNFADRDQHLTPLSVTRDVFYPGLFIHAQILAQLMDGRTIWEFNCPTKIVVTIVAGVLGLLLGLRSNPSSVPFSMIVAGRAGWLGLWSHPPSPSTPFGFRKNHRTYFWIEVAIVIGILAIAVIAFSNWHVIFPFNYVLIAMLAGAAVGHYAFSDEEDA